MKLTASLLPVETTSGPFSLIDSVAGAAVARRLAALTVSATPLALEGPPVGSETKTPSESVPVEPAVGADVSPLKAASRLASVPVAVNEAEPLVPVVKLNPVVEPRVSLPRETDSESESELQPTGWNLWGAMREEQGKFEKPSDIERYSTPPP